MALIGGINHFLGPVVGAIIFIYAHNTLVQSSHAWKLILGFILVLIVIFAPNGLLGLFGSRDSGQGRIKRIKTFLTSRSARKKSDESA
jgi:ABC-type branched-subunit amino acid transport system permease subunit